LDTSVLIPWLKENYGCEVIAVSGDVGQKSELDGLEEKALATGASYEDYRNQLCTSYHC
jgi:argininosuccinate synthase